MNSFDLFKTNWKFKFDIAGFLGVMRQFYMIVVAVFIRGQSQAQVPFQSGLLPILIPFAFRAGTNKKLHLHLLEFPHPEYKLTRYNFIPESLSNLRYTKWYFHAPRF